MDVQGKLAQTDLDKLQPINLSGQHVASRGPLVIPPSEQGQPVIASAGGGEYGLGLAGRYAKIAVRSSAYDFATIRQERDIYRSAAGQAGHDPDELKYFTGFMHIMGNTEEETSGRRMQMDLHLAPQQVPMLGGMPGWKGKRFGAEGTAKNLVDDIDTATGGGSLKEILPMRVTLEDSWLDGRPVIVCSYGNDSPVPWRWVRDEFRPLDARRLIGLTFAGGAWSAPLAAPLLLARR